MNLQEREHWDYENGAASENQNAFAISRMLAGPLREPRIKEELEAGRFVVIQRSLVWCLSTDACIGERETWIQSFECRADAEALAASYPGDDEVWFDVLPRELQADRASTEVDAGFDDVPF